jgi:hypothetical protein
VFYCTIAITSLRDMGKVRSMSVRIANSGTEDRALDLKNAKQDC